jgi:hypothetical protein
MEPPLVPSRPLVFTEFWPDWYSGQNKNDDAGSDTSRACQRNDNSHDYTHPQNRQGVRLRFFRVQRIAAQGHCGVKMIMIRRRRDRATRDRRPRHVVSHVIGRLARYLPSPPHRRARLLAPAEARGSVPGPRPRSASWPRPLGEQPLAEVIAALRALSGALEEAFPGPNGAATEYSRSTRAPPGIPN